MTSDLKIAALQNEVEILKKKITQLEQALDHTNQMFIALHEEVGRLHSNSHLLDDSLPGDVLN